jgi:transposase-like protein
MISTIFSNYSNDYELTAEGVFRRKVSPMCPLCGNPMNHNGFNTCQKVHLGEAKVGKYLCPACGKSTQEERGFWIQLNENFFDIITKISTLLRLNHVSYESIESVMRYIYPRDKDTIRNMVQCANEKISVPPVNNIQFVHYDEQHPKAGRSQKYRLTLLDSPTGQVIAEELFDSKDSNTIESFLRRNLDTQNQIFIVTDLYRGYSDIFKRVFGNRVIHQFCLLHLNKLIVGDFPRKTSIEQELLKYRMLNIFYNRELEIDFLSSLIEEERIMKQRGRKEYKCWIAEAKKAFYDFIHNLELKRRKENKNLEQRTYHEALNNFKILKSQSDSFMISVRKRLAKIEELWPNLTVFYFVDNAPATNNPIENYYSTSLKTHRKKQLEEIGIKEQMKLSALKRAGIFGRPQKTLLDAFYAFIPFLDAG